MFLMQALESLLGSIETWATAIIRLLFLDEPTPSTTRRVSAFFYGNGVPPHVASYFYNLRNEQGGLHVTDIMHTFYFIGQCSRYTPHIIISCGLTVNPSLRYSLPYPMCQEYL